jgi:hypothetical protein
MGASRSPTEVADELERAGVPATLGRVWPLLIAAVVARLVIVPTTELVVGLGWGVTFYVLDLVLAVGGLALLWRGWRPGLLLVGALPLLHAARGFFLILDEVPWAVMGLLDLSVVVAVAVAYWRLVGHATRPLSRHQPTADGGQAAAPRRSVGILLLVGAGTSAVYWAWEVARWMGDEYVTALDLAYMVGVGATMTLLIVLGALHFLPPLPQTVTRWRIPAAIALAALALPLTGIYGFGFYAAACAVVLARRAWREGPRSAPSWVALLGSSVALLVTLPMLLIAVGMCGPRMLIGICDA